MSTIKVFAARLVGCFVFDPQGDRVGRVRDLVVVYRKNDPPRVVGIIVEIPGKRRVFLSIGRVASVSSGQVIITSGRINIRRFEQRGGEVRVIAEILGRKVRFVDGSGEAVIEDVAIVQHNRGDWDIAQLFVRRPKGLSPFSKGQTAYVTWLEVQETGRDGGPQSAEHLLATYSEMNPADLASTLLDLPMQRRQEVAEELSDDRLADVLEEMPETEQVQIISALNDDRAADVLDQMQPDDAADLIAQLPEEQGEHLLDLMEPEEAEDVRQLLSYAPDTAGGLMTPEPIILSPDATVAEALATIRREELRPALGAAICITLPPHETPTGKYLGMVHFQKLLRFPPHERLGTVLDQSIEPVTVGASAAEVSRALASYDLVSIPVVDDRNRLVGLVTVDDVLDYLLPEDWRRSTEDALPRPALRRGR